MKRQISAVAIGLLISGSSFAADHSEMHKMMMKGGGPKEDTRIELKMPEPMKVMHKGIMRTHLDDVSEIAAALAANDLAKAAKIAKENLGWSDSQEKMCSMFGQSAGKDFLLLGKAMHTKADEIADAAKAGNRDKALLHLSQMVKDCNTCHEKYRH